MTVGAQAAVAAPAFSASSWTAYVTNNNSGGSVTPISLTSGTPGTAIPVGTYPDDVAIAPDGTTAYVANYGGDSVTPITIATGTAGTAIPIGGAAWAVAISPDGGTVYVTNITGNSVIPITTATDTVGSPISVGDDPQGIAITPDGKTAYVTNYSSDSVTPITLATGTPSAAIPVGSHPQGVAITPDGRTVYVTNVGDGTVTPIATATNTPGTPIPVGSSASDPGSVAITPDGKTAYVTDLMADAVTPIATATNTPESPIPVGGQPEGVAITPDGKTAYVANNLDGTVTPIATATNTAGTPIPVGSHPWGVAITPDQAPTASFSTRAAPAGDASSFDAAASASPVGLIASYQWDFGDGQSTTSPTPIVSHTYARSGVFTARLTVVNTAGTSLAQVFTGQTASSQGGPQATTTQTVSVPTALGSTPPTPRLTRLRISPRTASIAGRRVSGHCVKPTAHNDRDRSCRRTISLRVTYALTAAARVVFTFKRDTVGRTVKRRCVALNRQNRNDNRCGRLTDVPGRLTQAGRPGANALNFAGKTGGDNLSAGTYQLTATPNHGSAERITFRISH
ncbi:MAG TPA: PKD domain-containing protein [Solirubrobacteraceae bacterium]|nr:PKD domain-containing protein [Solirubrobacteraceae bacterium]